MAVKKVPSRPVQTGSTSDNKQLRQFITNDLDEALNLADDAMRYLGGLRAIAGSDTSGEEVVFNRDQLHALVETGFKKTEAVYVLLSDLTSKLDSGQSAGAGGAQ